MYAYKLRNTKDDRRMNELKIWELGCALCVLIKSSKYYVNI